MGIVVTIFMLLGLLQLPPLANGSLNVFARNDKNTHWVGFGVLIAGAWNALWHGLRYLDTFWGVAGLVSGLLMMLAAILVLSRSGSVVSGNRFIKNVGQWLKSISVIIVLGLAASFLLYATTLIRLNLGLSIIH